MEELIEILAQSFPNYEHHTPMGALRYALEDFELSCQTTQDTLERVGAKDSPQYKRIVRMLELLEILQHDSKAYDKYHDAYNAYRIGKLL